MNYRPKRGVGARVWIASIVSGVVLCAGIAQLALLLGMNGRSVLLGFGAAFLGSSLSALLAVCLLRPAHRTRRDACWVALMAGVPTVIISGLVALICHFLGVAANC